MERFYIYNVYIVYIFVFSPQVTKVLREWVASYRSEAIKAIRGIGKYRLAPGYDQFYVDLIRYLRWSSERKREHAEIFFAYVPACSENFSRPSNAGLKCNPNKKRRRDQNEPEVFTYIHTYIHTSLFCVLRPFRNHSAKQPNHSK